MSAADRREEIAAYVVERGEVRIDDLAQAFGVSRMTIHRHVDELAQQGLLRKLHGAVSASPTGVYESLWRYRQNRETIAKSALARAALAEIRPGQSVMIDDSTTASALAPHLAAQAPLTLATNSLGLMQSLAGQKGIELIALGGDYHPTYNAFIGPICENTVASLRVNLAICSASAISGEVALIQDARVTRVKQAMLASAARRILLVDASKFGRIALHRFAALQDFDAVYTNAALSSSTAADLRAAGIPLILVTDR